MTQPITPAELRARVGDAVFTDGRSRVLTGKRGAKYGNRHVFVEELSRWFDSQHEATQAVILRRREQAGEIRDLAFQTPFDLVVNGVLVCRYLSDFAYEEKHTPVKPTDPLPGPVVEAELGTGAVWCRVVADAKGVRTPVFKLKKRLMAACLGVDVKEV